MQIFINIKYLLHLLFIYSNIHIFFFYCFTVYLFNQLFPIIYYQFMESNFLFNLEEEPSQQKILPNETLDEDEHLNQLRFQQANFKSTIKPIVTEKIKIEPLIQRQSAQKEQNQNVIVFDFEEVADQSPTKKQRNPQAIRIKKCRKEITKDNSTQDEVNSEKQQPKNIIQLQHPISAQQQSQKRELQPIPDQSGLISQSEAELILPPIFKPKQKALELNSQFKIQQILFFPRKFHLQIQFKHKLTARRKIFHSSSLYYFFTNREDLSTKGPYYIGYMQSNFKGTQYNIYTTEGINLAHIAYIVNQSDPIQIKIYIPKIILQKEKRPILSRYNQHDPNILLLKNKKPTYNFETKKFSLNLKGRAKLPSMKNCAFEYRNAYCLIFGKQKDRLYHLEFGAPFSQFTAFALCISNYEDKFGISEE